MTVPVMPHQRDTPATIVHLIPQEARVQKSALGGSMKDVVMRMCGIALLWVGLAALVYVPSSGGGAKAAIVSVVGFISFAAGFSLIADALKHQIVEQLRRRPSDG